MKRLLLTLAILLAFSTNSQQINHTYDHTPYVERYVLDQVCKDYLNSDVVIEYISESPLHSYIGGVTHELGPHHYLIQLSAFVPSEISRMKILLHEVGHVIDMETGRLDFQTQTWDGIQYPPMAWPDRPWEHSADQWAECLFYEYVIEPELKRRGLIPVAGPRIKFD